MNIGCDGKEGFITWEKANRVLKALRRHRSFSGKVNVYRCAHCPNWHIGRKKGSK